MLPDKSNRYPPKVLLIDENRSYRAHLINAILNLRCSPIEIASPRLGWAMATHYQPDLILSEVVFSDFPGLELVSRLKCDPALAMIPLVAVTSLPPEQFSIYRASGCDDYLCKPVTLETLASVLRTHLPCLPVTNPVTQLPWRNN